MLRLTAILRQTTPGDRLLLALPDPPDEFAHPVRLQLLRRQADEIGVEVGLMTTDRDVRRHARQARLPTYADPDEAEQRWRYPSPLPPLPGPERIRPTVVRPPLDVGLNLTAPDIVSGPEGALLVGGIRRRPSRGWLTAAGYVAVVAAFLALMMGMAVLLLPQATVTLVPAKSVVVSSIDVTAQVGIEQPSYANRVVPARVVQARVESSGTVPTTGSDDAPVGNAGGFVNFINRTNRQVQVPANTIVRTTTGNNVRFRVLNNIIVPAGIGLQAGAAIEALEPGRRGNVPALTINEIEGPLNLTLRVTNPGGTGGGTVANVTVVTQADKDRLLGQLQEELQTQAYERLGADLRQGEYVPPETVRTFTLAETYDRFAGEKAETLGLQLQLLARGLAIDLASATELALRVARENVPPGQYLIEDSVATRPPTFSRFDDESAVFTITTSGDALLPVSTGKVRSLLAGAPLPEASRILQRNLKLAAPPQVELTPNWLNRLPYIPTRIKVRILRQPPT